VPRASAADEGVTPPDLRPPFDDDGDAKGGGEDGA
jgi:hypothetical protein